MRGNHWLVTVAALSHLALLFVLAGLAGCAAALSQLGVAPLAFVLGLILTRRGILLQGLNLPISLQVATFILALAVLAGAFSFVPAGLGFIEASLFVLLLWRSVPHPEAAA